MDNETHRIINDFRSALEENGTRVTDIVLFGSRARDSYSADSDIDLVVVSDDFEGKNLWERGKILGKAVWKVFEPIEALAYTSEEWQQGTSIICDIIKQTGSVVPA